jgi:DnaJ-class molecular chaperone
MEKRTEYILKKVTYSSVMCKVCGGTGTIQNGRKCIECKQGVALIQHQTEIGLIEALNELRLIKPPTS